MAQVGADLTQFRLGMNEVDARLNQVKVRSEAGARSVAAMRAEAARLTSSAAGMAVQRTGKAAAVAAVNAGLPLMKQAATDAKAELAKAEVALNAFGAKRTATSAKGLSAAEAEVAKRKKIAQEAEADYKSAERQTDKLTAAVERLGKAEEIARRRAIGMSRTAESNEENGTASAAVAAAYAQRLKQNSNEHRIRSLNTMSGVAENAGMAGLGVLGAATVAGASYNQMLVQTAHNTSLSASGVKVMNDTVRDLGSSNGGDMKEIAQGFRLMTDYGNTAAQSQAMLTIAMRASVATGSDLITTSELLAKATKEFNLPQSQAATTMGIMIEAGRRSTLTQEQMVQVGGQLYATAANLGVSFIDANAALVTYTKHGLSAAQASTQLRNDINKIIAPSKSVRDILKDVGARTGVNLTADFSTAGLRARTLLGIWQDIVKASERMKVNPVDLTAKLFPNLRGTVGAIISTGTGFKDFAKDRASLAKVATAGGDPISGMYNQSLGQLNVQLERLKNIATIAASDISTVLTPSVVNMLSKVDSGVQSFSRLDAESRATWTKMAASVSVGLIVFGVLGKLIVGVAALNTALITLRGVGIAGTLASLGPWGLALAAVAVAVGGIIMLYNKFNAVHEVTTAELKDMADKQSGVASANLYHASTVASLVSHYSKLLAITRPNKQQLQELHAILNRISILSPDLVRGYNAQGNAIGLVSDAAAKAAENIREMTRASQDAASKQLDIKAQDIAQQNSDRRDDLTRVKYSLKTGMFPDKDDNGGYSWDRPRVSVINKNRLNPYLSQDQTALSPLFGFGSKLPRMHKGTAEDISQANAQLRLGNSIVEAQEASRKRLVVQGMQVYKVTKIAPLSDPFHANQLPMVPGPDPLAGIGSKNKDSKAKNALKEATAYLEELRKKEYEVTHTGVIMANEWEISNGKLKDMGQHYADVSRQIVRQTMALELNKKAAEAARAVSLIGHDDIKAGMELAGGYDTWKDLSSKQKAAYVSSASHASISQGLYGYGEGLQKRAYESQYPVKTARDEAGASISEYIDKMHGDVSDPKFKAQIKKIYAWAKIIDDADLDKFAKTSKREIYDRQTSIGAENAGDKGKMQAAFNEWKANNADRLAAMPGTRRKTLEDSIHSGMNLEYTMRKEAAAQKTIDDLVQSTLAKTNELSQKNPFLRWVETLKQFNKDKGIFELPTLQNGLPASIQSLRDVFDKQRDNSALEQFDATLEDIKKQSAELKTQDPFEKWLHTFMIFKSEANGGKGGFAMPGSAIGRPMDISTARVAYDTQEQNGFDEKTRSTMAGLNEEAAKMREGDPFKVWLTSYEKFDQTANHGRGAYVMPGGNPAQQAANKKTLNDIYGYQTKIDLMKKASEGLTGVIVGAIDQGYGKGFKGMFQNIKQGFTRMLFDMATQFLQSQLLQLLQSKLFGATGVGGAQGGGGGGMNAAGIGSSILGIASSFFGGGGGGGSIPTTGGISSGPFSVPSVSFNGRALGGPIFAGETYITGEHGRELITAGSNGYVHNARDTSMMLGGGRGDTHNYNINISTPDPGSFHRSSGAILDDVHKAAARAHARSR